MRTFSPLFLLPWLLTLSSAVQAIPPQQPEIGTNNQVWEAINQVWKIRQSKKWGDALSADESAAVMLALDSSDDWMMNRAQAFFTPQIFKHLFPGDDAREAKIRVVAAHQAYAGFDKASNTIDISIGLVQAMYWTQWAVEEARENTALRPHLAAYLFALSRNNFQRTPLSASSVIRLTEFVTGKAWHPNSALTNQIEARVSGAVLDSLVFIISHEGCHALKGHAPLRRGDAAMRQEWAADECAVARLGQASSTYIYHFNPYLALGVLALFGLDDNHLPRALTTHPHALCRMGWMAYNGGNVSASIKGSLELLPLIVDAYAFKQLAQDYVSQIPSDYRVPTFLALHRIAAYCGGFQRLNPRAFPAINERPAHR